MVFLLCQMGIQRKGSDGGSILTGIYLYGIKLIAPRAEALMGNIL